MKKMKVRKVRKKMKKVKMKKMNIFLSADLFLLSSQRGTQSVCRSDWVQILGTDWVQILFGTLGVADDCLKQQNDRKEENK